MQTATLEREIVEHNSYRPLGILPSVDLTNEQFYSLNKLERFQAPYLEEKILKDGKFDSPEDYQEVFSEFKRYVALAKLNKEPIGMSSHDVDEVWHQFILFTPQYHDFCNDILEGKYLYHIPKTSYTPSSPSARENFVRSYEKMFGEIPEIWDLSSDLADPCDTDNCCTNPPDDD